LAERDASAHPDLRAYLREKNLSHNLNSDGTDKGTTAGEVKKFIHYIPDIEKHQ